MTYDVILIEDEYWVRKSINRLCRMIPGVKVIGEFEGTEHVRAFAHEIHVDAAIVDVILPGESGFDAGFLLKKEFPKMKIIYTSAFDTYENHFSEYGGDCFLHKPFSLEELKNALFGTA